MAAKVSDYVAAGYFLSRYAAVTDCTGLELRRSSLAHDHSQRRFFPDAWTLSWTGASREERIERAADFGMTEPELDRVMAWADQTFDSVFGAWDVFFTLDGARTAARSFLRNAPDLELWGVGLHHSLVSDYCKASAPSPPAPGFAPTGASGVHRAACMRPAPLAEGGHVLGHEILIADVGCSFNSPESRHLDEREILRIAGVVPNGEGLLDSLEDALACCRVVESDRSGTGPITGWRPWLIVRYSL